MPSFFRFCRHLPLYVVMSLAAAVGAVSGILSRLLPATQLAKNDNVVLFVTAARLTADRKTWILPLHGWVHQLERDESIRRMLIACVLRLLGLRKDCLEAQFLRERLGWFLVDNKRTRMVHLRIGERELLLGPTDPQGHFRGELRMAAEDVHAVMTDGAIEIEVLSEAHAPRSFLGQVLPLGMTGVSVISDVDDTVKVTHVLDRKELMRNTLMRPFQPAPHMAAFYQRLAAQGASFHYVSCSPWHLYPALQDFLRDSGFPVAPLVCRRLRIKDSSLHEFFSTPDAFKIPRILGLLSQYPERRFLLVGDSGERDPEIYGQIARENPTQILGILIRNVTGASPDDPRWAQAFSGIEPSRWQLFTDPSELDSTKWL